ncbi:STAS/SEC14 domain-containing protein [Phenylobacterium sp.]|uniref:STAS/SEC14 domain-containing protein n=1 Tax=Phenylobacterium sp. TaxID=1871053 RepID=UPI0039C9E121
MENSPVGRLGRSWRSRLGDRDRDHPEFHRHGACRAWSDIRLAIPLAQKVDPVAVVADQKWIRQFAELGRMFTKAKLKVFAPDDLAEARAWIAAE